MIYCDSVLAAEKHGSPSHTSFPRKRESTTTRRSLGNGMLTRTVGMRPDSV